MGGMTDKSTSVTYGGRAKVPEMPDTTAPKPNGPAIDYVTITATLVLGCVAITDLIYGNGSVALAIGGAVGGYVTRLYK